MFRRWWEKHVRGRQVAMMPGKRTYVMKCDSEGCDIPMVDHLGRFTGRIERFEFVETAPESWVARVTVRETKPKEDQG